jgi:hypothetical protein
VLDRDRVHALVGPLPLAPAKGRVGRLVVVG